MRFLIELTDGVAVMETVDGASPDDCVAKWHESESSKIVAIREAGEIPEDRTFRRAWRASKRDVVVDMQEARAVWRDRIREVREPLLRKLDVEQLRGKDVAQEKQRLRDAPSDPRIDEASTPEELKAVWPEFLGELIR